MAHESVLRKRYELAREQYAEAGVDTEKALSALSTLSLSLHCWQGDDVGGFERPDALLSGGGLQVTGSFPGKARTIEELRADLQKTFSLLPGKHRLNLHAIYGEFGGKKIERDMISIEQFRGWVQWAGQNGLKLDFNPTCFSHPKSDDGFTLSHRDAGIREFWIEHVRRCREIAVEMGKAQSSPCINNLWIPDGSKDAPVDRWGIRTRLRTSLDAIYSVELPAAFIKDSVESKLFGIGSEAFVVGSHEFYLAYALAHKKMVCLDLGHFHPTELVADKISSLLQFFDELLLHVSRGVRWDSDHVVIFNDEVRSLAEEIVRSDALGKIHIALDYFDASLNRIGAWVTGARSTLKAMLSALLEPRERLRHAEADHDLFSRLAMQEEARLYPLGAVWDYYCLTSGVPVGDDWIRDVRRYETEVLRKRS